MQQTSNSIPVPSRWQDAVSLGLLTVAVVLLFYTSPRAGDFWWSDAPRHAMDGVFYRDLARNMPITHIKQCIVAPGCAFRPVAERDACLFRLVCERSIVVVVVESILAEICHENVRPAVVVKVSNRDAEPPAVVSNASLPRQSVNVPS